MNRPKVKGTRFESEVVRYFNATGHPNVERRALNGNCDKGDLLGLPGWVLECKDHGTLSLSTWLTEARIEAVNAGARWWAVIAKRRRSPGSTGQVSDSYVIMPLSVFSDLLAADQIPPHAPAKGPESHGEPFSGPSDPSVVPPALFSSTERP